MFPINIEYDNNNHELYVVTKSDIRVFNINNGQTMRILANVFSDEEKKEKNTKMKKGRTSVLPATKEHIDKKKTLNREIT